MNKKMMGLVALICSAVAAVAIFLPWIAVEAADESYNGLAIAFATEEGFKFSFMGLLVIILLVATVAIAVLKFVKSDLPAVLDYVLIACAVVAGVFLFLSATQVVTVLDLPDGTPSAFVDAIFEGISLGWGAIVGAIASIVAGVAAAVGKFVCKD